MKKLTLFVPLILLLIMFAHCDKNPFADDDPPKGAFSYTGYDSANAKIVTGWIKVSLVDSTELTGEWELKKVGQSENIGPQVGSGKLSGLLTDSVAQINLNPDWIDNNVFLLFDWDAENIDGTWQYVGFPGVLNHGSFSATK